MVPFCEHHLLAWLHYFLIQYQFRYQLMKKEKSLPHCINSSDFRGHPKTMLTWFWPFLTTYLPLVDIFDVFFLLLWSKISILLTFLSPPYPPLFVNVVFGWPLPNHSFTKTTLMWTQGIDLFLCNRMGQRKAWHLIGVVCVVASFPFIFSSCLGCRLGTKATATLVLVSMDIRITIHSPSK